MVYLAKKSQWWFPGLSGHPDRLARSVLLPWHAVTFAFTNLLDLQKFLFVNLGQKFLEATTQPDHESHCVNSRGGGKELAC